MKMRQLFFILFLSGLFLHLLPAQNCPNPHRILSDLCENARKISPGDTILDLSNEFATLGPPAQTPQIIPYTCIKTYENDLWFEFFTESGFDFYEIDISYLDCNTPAGLQAILIRSDGCNARDFQYRGCANYESMDPIRLILQEKQAGLRFLIHIDGFDGTICEFNLSLTGKTKNKLDKSDYKYLKYNYDFAENPVYENPDLKGKFLNNAFRMDWTAENQENIQFFLIEQIVILPDGDKFTQTLSVIDPINTVDGEPSHYTFFDETNTFEHDQSYCYRLVKVSSRGEKEYSEPICITASLVHGFYVFPVEKSPEPNKYVVKYLNQRDGKTYKLSVINGLGKTVKQFVLKKEPYQEGTITLNMEGFQSGTYYFKMGTGKDHFLREFKVE